MRLTLDNNGTAYSGATYDPWGSPERGNVGTFGFTGELQQGDQVYLRARWYNANNGTFTSIDPFDGYPQQPYSLHPYQYTYSNPVLWTDPSGEYPWAPSTAEGVLIHELIQANFLQWSLTWPGYRLGDVRIEYRVPGASKYQPNRRGNVPFERFEYDDLTLLVPGKQSSKEIGKIDIIDIKAYEIYEIKPKGSADLGRSELYWYLGHMTGYRIGTRTYPEGTRLIGSWPTQPYTKDWEIVAWIDRGVIVYQGRRKTDRIRDLVKAVCTVAISVVAGKKLWDEIRDRPRPIPRPNPAPQPAFDFETELPFSLPPIQPEVELPSSSFPFPPVPGGFQFTPFWP